MEVAPYVVTYENGSTRRIRLSYRRAKELERRREVRSVVLDGTPAHSPPETDAPSSDVATPAIEIGPEGAVPPVGSPTSGKPGMPPQPEGDPDVLAPTTPQASPQEAERVAGEDLERAAVTAGLPTAENPPPGAELKDHEEPNERERPGSTPDEDVNKEQKRPKRQRSDRDKQAQRARDKQRKRADDK